MFLEKRRPRLTVLQIKQTKGSEMFKKTLAAAALLGAFAGSAVAADVTLLVETAEVQAEKLMSALGEISAGRIRTKRQSDAS